MTTLPEYIQAENKLAIAMLEEATSNPEIHRILLHVSQELLNNMWPVIEEGVQTMTSSPEKIKEEPWKLFVQNMRTMIEQNSKDNRQTGALYPEKPKTELTKNPESMRDFFQALQEKLFHFHEKNVSQDDILIVLKNIYELGTLYYNYHSKSDPKRFEPMQHMLPSELELASRVTFTEMGFPEQLAITRGIGKTKNDVTNKMSEIAKETGTIAGKSIFAEVNTETRIRTSVDRYDAMPKADTKDAKFLRLYKISFDPSEREIARSIKNFKTWFEKLVTFSKENIDEQLPLVAAPSGATGRLFVSLFDLRLFEKPDHTFDFDTFQIFANCCYGFLGYAGHHSLTETAEIYNRALDQIGISQQESKDPEQEEKKPYHEETMPYYEIGRHSTFFYKLYQKKMEPLCPEPPKGSCRSPLKNSS